MSTFVKRGVSLAISLVVLVSLAGSASVAHAQTPGIDLSGAGAGMVSAGVSQSTPQPDTHVGSQQAETDIFDTIGYTILSLFAWFTGIAGVLLNAAVYYTVVQMASFVDNMGAIVVAWKVLRDVSNIILIFGFIAIGLATILDIQSYSAKRMLVSLIIVAVTVNFSLFAARAIIDVGNVFAYQFYAQMSQTAGGAPAEDLFNVTDRGVSNAIMRMVGLQTFYSADQSVVQGLTFVEFIFGALLFIVAAFVLFALAFMLIARFVILVFLMILSPFGFVGLVIPNMEGMAKKWWSTLISQSAVAPILLLMILISVTLMTTGNGIFGNTGGSGYAQGFSPLASESAWEGTASMILGYLISMGLLMASLIIAKQAGAFGANFAISTSRRITGMALSPISVPSRAIGNAGARFGARYGGKGVNALYNGSGLGSLFRKSGVLATLDADIQSSIDKTKNLKVAGRSLDDEKHAREHRDHQLHRDSDFKKTTATLKSGGDISQTLQRMSGSDLIEYVKGLSKEDRERMAKSLSTEKYSTLQKSDKLDDGIKAELANGRFSELLLQAANINPENKKEIRKWSAKDLAELAKVNAKAFEQLAEAKDLLSDDQRDGLEKSEVLTTAQRALVKNSSDLATLRRLIDEGSEDDAAAQTEIRRIVADMSSSKIAELSGSQLANKTVISTLRGNDFSAIMEKKKLSKPQLAVIRGEILKNPEQLNELMTYTKENGFLKSYLGLNAVSTSTSAPTA